MFLLGTKKDTYAAEEKSKNVFRISFDQTMGWVLLFFTSRVYKLNGAGKGGQKNVKFECAKNTPEKRLTVFFQEQNNHTTKLKLIFINSLVADQGRLEVKPIVTSRKQRTTETHFGNHIVV